jgi:hypothetical protein
VSLHFEWTLIVKVAVVIWTRESDPRPESDCSHHRVAKTPQGRADRYGTLTGTEQRREARSATVRPSVWSRSTASCATRQELGTSGTSETLPVSNLKGLSNKPAPNHMEKRMSQYSLWILLALAALPIDAQESKAATPAGVARREIVAAYQ